MGLATCHDVSTHAVVAWKHKFAASLLAQFRLDLLWVPRNWAIIGYRADATDQRIWADEKLHVCEIATTCLPDPPGQCKKPEDVWECLWHHKRYADLHKWFAGGVTVVSFN